MLNQSLNPEGSHACCAGALPCWKITNSHMTGCSTWVRSTSWLHQWFSLLGQLTKLGQAHEHQWKTGYNRIWWFKVMRPNAEYRGSASSSSGYGEEIVKALLLRYCWVKHWKNFEQQLTFAKVKNLCWVACFFDYYSVYISATVCVVHNELSLSYVPTYILNSDGVPTDWESHEI